VQVTSILRTGELQPDARRGNCTVGLSGITTSRQRPIRGFEVHAALAAQLSMCNASAAGVAVHTVAWNQSSAYWRDINGRPRRAVKVPARVSERSAHPRAMMPKAFSLHPPGCILASSAAADAEAAFLARYTFGWTRTADAAPLAAIQQQDPRYYYTRPSDRPSASGAGSGLGTHWTTGHLRFLVRQIERLGITTLMDAPCGDVNWQMAAWATDSLRAYIGLDIVEPVIRLNSRRFAHHSNKHFEQWDLATCPLPRLLWRGAWAPDERSHQDPRTVERDRGVDGGGGVGSPRGGRNATEAPEPFTAELLVMRQLLQHLPLERATAVLQNVVSSGVRYLVATTFLPASMSGARLDGRNKQTYEGGWFSNDLMAPPFSLHAPDECLHDEDGEVHHAGARPASTNADVAVAATGGEGRGMGAHGGAERKRPNRASAICIWTFDDARRHAWLSSS